MKKLKEETALKQYEVEMDEVNQQSEKDEEMLEKEAELDKMSLEFTKTIRIIEFLGDILKNYSSSIKRKPRIEIINLMYDSSMKLMGRMYQRQEQIRYIFSQYFIAECGCLFEEWERLPMQMKTCFTGCLG